MSEFMRRALEGSLPSKSLDPFVPVGHVEAKPDEPTRVIHADALARDGHDIEINRWLAANGLVDRDLITD